MIENHVAGAIPGRPFSRARVANGSLAGDYEVDWRRNTGSPLNAIEADPGHRLDVRFTESWFLDLEARTLENADAVTCRGMTRLAQGCREEINTATHWYVHPHDRECVVVDHRYYRAPPTVREILRPLPGTSLEVLAERILKSADGAIAVVTDGHVRLEETVAGIRLEEPQQRHGYVVVCGEMAGKVSRTPGLSVRLEPDPEAAGTCSVMAEEVEISVVIENDGDGLGWAEVAVYGALQGREKVRIGSGQTTVTLRGRATLTGLLPLLVLIEGTDYVWAKVWELLVLPTVLESSDPRFDGVFVEQVRSILLRRIFNVVPEDEPRGCSSYPLYFYPRNFTSYVLCAFGFHDLGFAHLEAYTEILKRDGFLAQDYYLPGQNLNLVTDTPQALLNANANDGIGFYLFHLAKCLFRHPDRKVDLAGVQQAIRWLALHTHWNGLLDDHSEPVSQAFSERLAGSPYSQGLCMAGLKAVAQALLLIGEDELAGHAQWLFRFQIDGFRRLYDEAGFIRDFEQMDRRDREPYLSGYSMPCPSLVLLDPEVNAHDLDHLYTRTLDELKTAITPPDNPWMIGKYHVGGGAYGQCGVIGTLLNLCRLDEAGGYMDEVLRHCQDTRLRYVLAEGIVYEEDFYRAHHAELKARAPWVYKDLDEREPGLPGGSSNPGCLVMPTYWLYCADLMCGISVGADRLTIWPKVPGYLTDFRVRGYHTRWGPVSYGLTKTVDGVTLRADLPAIETVLVVGPLSAITRVSIKGREVGFEEVESGDGCFARLSLPKAGGRFSVDVA